MDEVRYCLISGYPGYRIGDDGSGWSCWQFKGNGYGRIGTWSITDPPIWRRLSPDVRKSDGRLRFTLRAKTGEYRKVQVSHLVLEHFVGSKPSIELEACHNDGKPSNNHWTNLRWDTNESNRADSIKQGTQVSGENHPLAKLDWNKVRDIRAKFAAGGITKTQLGFIYGVTGALIGYVIKGTIWKEKADARTDVIVGNSSQS